MKPLQELTLLKSGKAVRPFSVNMVKSAEAGGYSLLDALSLLERLREGSLFVVDVRDAALFTQSHIEGAVCFPMPPTWFARFFKRWWLKKLLCKTTCKAVAFY